MKVLQVLPELNAGGVERTTLEIAETLYQNGHIPYICSNGGRMTPQFTSYKAQMYEFDIGSKSPFKWAAHIQRLVKIIEYENIDIIHARSRAPAWIAYKAARQTQRPFITTYHGIYKARTKLKRHYNAIMAKGEQIIANSAYTKTHIINEHNTPPARIRVIPRGVDMTLFNPQNITDKQITQQQQNWGLRPNEIALLLPGRLTRWKGQTIAVQALSYLPDNYRLILMGDAQGRDYFEQEIRQLATALNIDQRVIITGHNANVPTALAAAHIILNPSIEPEAFGRVVTEAQAMGRKIIATAHGGPMETIIAGQTGLLIPPNNASALAKSIQSIRHWNNYNPKFARHHIQTKFSKSHLQSQTMKVYKEILGDSE